MTGALSVRLTAVGMLLLVLSAAPCSAAPDTPPSKAAPEPYFTKERPRGAPLTSVIPVDGSLELQRKRIAWEIAYYEHLGHLMEYRVRVFKWHETASSVVLWLVCAVVGAGILFSGFQLWHAVSLKAPQANSELEISVNKLKVTSSVVGVVILVLSLGFVYLFVHEIYGVKIVDTFEQKAAPK